MASNPLDMWEVVRTMLLCSVMWVTVKKTGDPGYISLMHRFNRSRMEDGLIGLRLEVYSSWMMTV